MRWCNFTSCPATYFARRVVYFTPNTTFLKFTALSQWVNSTLPFALFIVSDACTILVCECVCVCVEHTRQTYLQNALRRAHTHTHTHVCKPTHVQGTYVRLRKWSSLIATRWLYPTNTLTLLNIMLTMHSLGYSAILSVFVACVRVVVQSAFIGWQTIIAVAELILWLFAILSIHFLYEIIMIRAAAKIGKYVLPHARFAKMSKYFEAKPLSHAYLHT